MARHTIYLTERVENALENLRNKYKDVVPEVVRFTTSALISLLILKENANGQTNQANVQDDR